MTIQQRFDDFVSDILLPAHQVERIESARTALSEYLRRAYALSADQIFLQGSYANKTAIRPSNGGEYDVDVVCVCMPASGVSSTSALNDLQQRLAASGNYKPRIKAKNPCVRLEFAEDEVGKFHVDVVPVRPATNAPLDAPHRQRGWHETAPAEYTRWCQEQGGLYARTVRMLKQWRNEQQPVREAIKSIVLQVLVSQNMPAITDDAQRIAETFNNLAHYIEHSEELPIVSNPVLPSENLAATWPRDAFQNFKKEIAEAQEISQLAHNEGDEEQAASLWSLLFGDRFPSTTSQSHGLALADYSHAQTEDVQGWSQHVDNRYTIGLSARVHRGYGSQISKRYEHNGPPIFAGNKIKFKAIPEGPADYEIWWQVANTGGHARSVNGLRGEFFRAKGPTGIASRDPAVNWEDTKYTGVHLIRPLLVVRNNVVAKAPWMRINVINPSRPFTL